MWIGREYVRDTNGRFDRKGKDPRNARLEFRLTTKEYGIIYMLARKRNISMAEQLMTMAGFRTDGRLEALFPELMAEAVANAQADLAKPGAKRP